jgi:glucosamine-6-phosphate deaminase
MEIKSGFSYDELSHEAASIIASQLVDKPASNLALAWGSSPAGAYKVLAQCFQEGWSQALLFKIDEYLGSAIGQELLQEQLLQHVDLPSGRCICPAQVDRYDDLIDDAGGLDLLVLGFGRNGHIAACEPGTSFQSQTHLVQLAPETIEDNFAKYGEMLYSARTMGLATMFQAKKVVLLISGAQKLEAARQALFGPVQESVPASILQRHSNLTVLCDFPIG